MEEKMIRKISYVLLLALSASAPLVFTTGCAVTRGRETMGQYTDDKVITSKVKTALVRDPAVKGGDVNVTTFQGVVQLSGFVENQTQKERAGELARQVNGVSEVHNDLIVQTGRYTLSANFVRQLQGVLVQKW